MWHLPEGISTRARIQFSKGRKSTIQKNWLVLEITLQSLLQLAIQNNQPEQTCRDGNQQKKGIVLRKDSTVSNRLSTLPAFKQTHGRKVLETEKERFGHGYMRSESACCCLALEVLLSKGLFWFFLMVPAPFLGCCCHDFVCDSFFGASAGHA